MEFIKDVVIDFCLFSFIEGFIYCYFFNIIGKLEKFKFKEILILSIGNCLISQIFPPVIYQSIMILWMSILLNKFKKIKLINGIKLSLYGILFLLITEMTICIFYEIFFNLDFSKLENLKLFLIIIPMKIIQILFIRIGESLMKTWAGEVRR